MMTAEQRYLFDLHGYLHLKNVLSAEELAAARAAAERYVDSPPDQLPEGFRVDGRRYEHGFAFDPALERLTMHPATWPIVTELTRGRPRLVSGTLQINAAATDQVQPLRLHCARDDYGWDAIRYEVRDGRIFCDHTVVFPYLTDVHPGDGGLVVVPGSHKSLFERPPELFNNGVLETLEQLPAGIENITPRAGDMVVMNELVTHGALPWTPRDRGRMILVLRYMPQYSRAPDIPEAVQQRLTPDVLELTSHAGYQDVKKIVGHEAAAAT